MQKKSLYRLVAVLVFAGVSWASACAEEPLFAEGATSAAPLSSSNSAEETAVQPAPIPALELPEDPDAKDAYVNHLASYLYEDIISHWTPAVKQVPTADLAGVAWDVARAVVHEPEDPGHCQAVTGSDGRKRCLWGVPGWNSDHAKATLLAGVGYWEGARYAADVDNGNCNNPEWRADPANAPLIHIMGNCDHGRAHSLWQVWPRVGSAHDSPINESCSLEAVSTRYGAARCALQILRMSMMSTEDLTGYTGEPTWGDKTKATLRLEFARKALKKHPFTPLVP